jgi:hypothetical protein
MKNANSATITALALAANRGLTRSDDSQFNRLIAKLDEHKAKTFATFSKFKSLDPCDIESAYLEAVWNEVRRYTSADKGPFIKVLTRAVTSRVYDLLDKGKKDREHSESLDGRVEAIGDAALPFEASEERLFELREEVREHFTGVSARNPGLTAEQRALYRTDADLELSSREVVNLAPELFKNHQQYLREKSKHTSRVAR